MYLSVIVSGVRFDAYGRMVRLRFSGKAVALTRSRKATQRATFPPNPMDARVAVE